MAKQVNIRHVELLLARLSEKTGQSRDHFGFGIMSDKIDGSISQKYLYERLEGQVKKAHRQNELYLNISINKVDEIARFLGFSEFDQFVKTAEQPVDPLLLTCMGNYYCYVRRSTPSGVIFRSPVQIDEKGQEVWLTLKGPQWSYSGRLFLRNGCLFCLMTAEGGKAFHHVYRIGNRQRPIVLQGIFSGISTAQEPIGGRVVLIRQDDDFRALEHREMVVQDLKDSGLLEERGLAGYFDRFEKNNLQVSRSITFDLDDLNP